MVFRPNPYDPRQVLTQDQESSATTYNVTSTGNDESGDGSASNPFLTIGRALQEISLRSQYPHVIQVGSGTFTLPNDAQLFGQNDFIFIRGTKTVESTETVSAVLSGSQAAGIRVRVTGSPGWTNGEHVGKLIQWTSGAVNGFWGVIYDNDADSIWVTTDRTGAYATGVPISAPPDTFQIFSLDTTLQVNSTVGVFAPKLRIEECDISGTGTFATQSGSMEFRFCSISLKQLNAGHASIIFLNRSYLTGTAFVVNSAENAAVSIQRGCVLDGDSGSGLNLDQGTCVYLSGETVITRLDSSGISCRGISMMAENTDATLRFYNSAAGFIDKGAQQSVASNVSLPFVAGNITGSYVIDARLGSKYFFNGGTVTTSVGNNTCSVDGSNESYFKPNHKTRIHGSGNTSDNTIAADATTVDVSYSLCETPIWVTSANTGATAITNFTNGFEGQEVIIEGGSSTNATTIADGGNFELAGGATITFNTDVKALFRLSNSTWKEMWRRAA